MKLKKYTPAQIKERAEQKLEMLGLKDQITKKASQLSGGQQQRVAIARALINDPVIIFGDEPTGNLDSRNGANILRLLRELTDETGTALVLVTHSAEAAAICHREIQLRDGEIVGTQLRDGTAATA